MIHFPKYRNVKIKGDKISGEEWMIATGKGFWCNFSGCSSLMKIHLAWMNGDVETLGSIIDECDLPQMAMEGDWSGIRDSSKESVARMEKVAEDWFNKHCKGDWPWIQAEEVTNGK